VQEEREASWGRSLVEDLFVISNNNNKIEAINVGREFKHFNARGNGSNELCCCHEKIKVQCALL